MPVLGHCCTGGSDPIHFHGIFGNDFRRDSLFTELESFSTFRGTRLSPGTSLSGWLFIFCCTFYHPSGTEGLACRRAKRKGIVQINWISVCISSVLNKLTSKKKCQGKEHPELVNICATESLCFRVLGILVKWG